MKKLHVELAIEEIVRDYLFGSIDKLQAKERFEGILSLIKYVCMNDDELKKELKLLVVDEYRKINK
jgi:hypothetical protein